MIAAATNALLTTRYASSASPIVTTPSSPSTPPPCLATAPTAPAARQASATVEVLNSCLYSGSRGRHDRHHRWVCTTTATPTASAGGRTSARERPHRAEVDVQRAADLLAHPLDAHRDLGLRDAEPDERRGLPQLGRAREAVDDEPRDEQAAVTST